MFKCDIVKQTQKIKKGVEDREIKIYSNFPELLYVKFHIAKKRACTYLKGKFVPFFCCKSATLARCRSPPPADSKKFELIGGIKSGKQTT